MTNGVSDAIRRFRHERERVRHLDMLLSIANRGVLPFESCTARHRSRISLPTSSTYAKGKPT
jgi:hypothetical protein